MDSPEWNRIVFRIYLKKISFASKFKRKFKRCRSRNKKVGLAGLKCRYGSTSCSLHRYRETHNCSFDFNVSGRDAFAKANPVVKYDKLDRL